MQQLSQGSPERRVEFSEWRGHVDRRLDKQDDALRTLPAIDKKLDLHIENTNNWKEELRPLIADINQMKADLRVRGILAELAKWMLAAGASIAAIWASLHGTK